MMEDLGESDTAVEHKNNLRSPIDVATANRKGSHGFLQKLFSRQPSTPALKATELEDDIMRKPLEDTLQQTYNNLEVLPCPYTRPLQNRLEPRMENTQLVHRRLRADSAIPSLRKKTDSAHEVLNNQNRNCAGEQSESHEAGMDCTESRERRFRDDVALAATADATHLQKWINYIKCYSEGCYNLIKPPPPPPLNPSFNYLPSTYPSNEAKRLATFESSSVWSGTDIIWSESEAELARSLIKAADVRFNTPWGAISFFDTEMEIVQAERGYSRHFIPRHQSIASHVLLTNEVMTILDTVKDWRFAGNPLVVGEPRIRFFAGAPLLSANSEVVGVFAIFSPEPRTTFTAKQRRELTIFSESAMRELTSLAEVNPNETLQTPPLSNDGSVRFNASESNAAPLDGGNGTGSPDVTPPALRYHEPSHRRKIVSRIMIEPQNANARSSPPAHTPVVSSLSHVRSAISTDNNSLGENHEQHSFNSGSTLSSQFLDTPESPMLHDQPIHLNHELESLEFLDHNHSNAEFEAGIKEDSTLTGANQFTASLSTMQATTFRSTETPNDGMTVPVVTHMNHISSSDYAIGTHPFGLDCEWPVPPKEELERPKSSRKGSDNENVTGIEIIKQWDTRAPFGSPSSHKPLDEEQLVADPIAEASFAAEFWAKHLGFDTIYAVELVPKKFFMTEDDLNSPGAIETRTIVSYGLQEPIEFDILMHLNVLRTSGAMTWENTHGSSKDYSIGFMMPLKVNPSLLEFRSIGVVFGAFRKTDEDIEQACRLSSAEIKRLQQAARVLKNILRKSAPVMKFTPSETKFPPTPTPKGYVNNEAADLAKYSFDGSSDHLPMKRKPSKRSQRKPE